MDHSVSSISTNPGLQAALLALNNESAQETSLLDAPKFAWMIRTARVATVMAPARAFLLAFDQGSAYDGAHFQWFRQRVPRFLYIDRVVVAADARRAGFGRMLYADLFARAAQSGHGVVTCEVNQHPANPVSDAFHAQLGFTSVGTAAVAGSGKIVRYLLWHGEAAVPSGL